MSGDRPRSRLFARPSVPLVPSIPGPPAVKPPPRFETEGEPTVLRPRVPQDAPAPEIAEPAPEIAVSEPVVAATLVPFDEGDDATLLDIPRGDEEPAELEGEALSDADYADAPNQPGPWDRPIMRVRRLYTPGMLSPAPLPPGKVRALSSAQPAAATPTAAATSVATAPPPPTPPAATLPQLAMASAPGKIILIGEHAVVYGHRAIAAAVELCTTVTLRRRPGPSRIEDGGDEDPRLAMALGALIPEEGVGISIRSTLPVGCGMGSSAALAVATVRALARLEGREAGLPECVERGFVLERVFHGNPSGLDHTVSASGGALIYRRGQPAEELVVGRALRLVIANTGTPGDTAEMVAKVRQRNPMELLMRVGALVEMTAVRIAAGQPVGEFLREAHRMMRLMGVSTPRLDDLCRAMEGAGSTGAKLAGAGGGGIVIALVDERTEDAVRRAAEPLAPGGVFTTDIAATRRT